MHCVLLMEEILDGREQLGDSVASHSKCLLVFITSKRVPEFDCSMNERIQLLRWCIWTVWTLLQRTQEWLQRLWFVVPKNVSSSTSTQGISRAQGKSASWAVFYSDKNRKKNVSPSPAYPWWVCTAATGTSQNPENGLPLPHCGKFSG